MKTIGFIGCGNMGRAILEGMLKAKLIDGRQVYVSNRHLEHLVDLQQQYRVKLARNLETAARSDILFLAVKPYSYESVIHEIRDVVKEDVIIINIAAGICIDDVEKMFGRNLKVVKVMPNTPVLVGKGMSGISFNRLLSEQEKKEIIQIFECFGKVELVDESLMNVVGSASGSSPAFVFMLIEAMADACVKMGMSRAQAYRMVAQAVKGSAEMVLTTGKHPAELKDMVCSPNGTTIVGVKVLEENGFRFAIMEALEACARRTEELMGKKD